MSTQAVFVVCGLKQGRKQGPERSIFKLCFSIRESRSGSSELVVYTGTVADKIRPDQNEAVPGPRPGVAPFPKRGPWTGQQGQSLRKDAVLSLRTQSQFLRAEMGDKGQPTTLESSGS